MAKNPTASQPTSASGSKSRRHRVGCAQRAALAWLLALSCWTPAWADRGNDQIALAANGRYDLLETMLEQQGMLDTRDRHALCYAYAQTKRYSRLFACLDQLEAVLAKGGDPATRLFGLEDATPALGLMRAEALLELGQYQSAARVAQANLDWLDREQSEVQDLYEQSLSVQSMAATLSGDRQLGQALSARLARSVPLFGGDPSAHAQALARTRMALGDYAGVLAAINSNRPLPLSRLLEQLLGANDRQGDQHWAWQALPQAFMLNKALLESGQPAAARAGFERLLALPQVQQNKAIYGLLLSELAQMQEQAQQYTAALALYRQAFDVLAQQHTGLHTETRKTGYRVDMAALYGRAITLALTQQQAQLAFEWMERSLSHAQVALLAADGPQVLPGRHPDSAALLATYRAEAEQANLQLPREVAQSRLVSGNALSRLKAGDPALAAQVSVDAPTLPQVQQGLRDDEVLLEYYQNGETLLLVAASRSQVQAVRLEGAGLMAQVQAFRKLIAERRPEAELVARALYQRLLAPAAALLAGRQLVIVPHGVLHALPFAALHDGDDYLIARHGLRYLPSASLQPLLRPPSGAGLSQMLLVDAGASAAGHGAGGTPLQQLVERLTASQMLVGPQASATRFRQLAGPARYLHLALPLRLRHQAPLQSQLEFAADEQHGSRLTVADIYQLRLQADLVTLAGPMDLPAGPVGETGAQLVRSFLYAGSSNLVTSLWPADEAASAALMTRFYQHLQSGLAPQQALRQAQQTLRAQFPSPRDWAGFYLSGVGSAQ